MAGFLLRKAGRMAITLWVIATVVFAATRLTGNPIDFLMPEGLEAGMSVQDMADLLTFIEKL